MLFEDINSKRHSPSFRKKLIGKRGEKVARSYLRKAGWRFISKNVRFGNDELDILAITPDERTLVIVEVRSTALEHKKPEHTIGRAKRTTMLRIAKQLRGHARQHSCLLRVDLVTVCIAQKKPKIEHFRGILQLSQSRSFS